MRTPDGQQMPSAVPPAAVGRGWNWVLRILGVILALGGGIALWYVLVAADAHVRENGTLLPVWVDILAFLLFIGWAALVAALLRTWWSFLIVPLAFYVGILLAVSGFDLGQLIQNGLLEAWVVLILAVPAAVLGAWVGTYLGMRVEGRLLY